jgi:hypothetical protein
MNHYPPLFSDQSTQIGEGKKIVKNTKGRTRIRTGVTGIRNPGANRYTIQPHDFEIIFIIYYLILQDAPFRLYNDGANLFLLPFHQSVISSFILHSRPE